MLSGSAQKMSRERDKKKEKKKKGCHLGHTPESTDQSRSTTVVGIEQMIQILFKVGRSFY
jgi:hypothetical protein